MEFYSPPTDLGAMMPQTEFAAPTIDWTHITPFDSTEANQLRQANDKPQHLEQWILGQNPINTQIYHNQSSLSTISEPSRLLLGQNSTTETPARSVDIEKTAAAQDSSSGDHHMTMEDDDTASTITAAATITTSNANSRQHRRRRVPNRRRSGSGGGDSSEGGGPTEAARAKNRLAATKCRRKKKVEERGLEERQRRLHLQRAVLREAADALAHEVLTLKHEILRHAACGFPPVDHYIADAAARGSVSSASPSVSAS